MSKRVIIIGAGGHGKVIADIVRKCGDELVGFLDDAYTEKTEFYGSTIYGKTEKYKEFTDCQFIVAIGNNSIRKRVIEALDCEWYTAIHPSAQISDSVKIGKGVCVMANAVINSDSHIGNHTIVNTGAIIEHDCKIGNYCHISPRATVCGVTTLGENVWIGAGATIKNVLSICSGVIVGMGAVVIESITKEGTYVGVPAKLRGN